MFSLMANATLFYDFILPANRIRIMVVDFRVIKFYNRWALHVNIQSETPVCVAHSCDQVYNRLTSDRNIHHQFAKSLREDACKLYNLYPTGSGQLWSD